MKQNALWLIIGLVIIVVGLTSWSKLAQNNDPNVITTGGLHWHPTLTIYADGEKQEIPANVGLMGGHQPMHTHVEDAADGVIHLEFPNVVRTDDVRLGRFFDIWNKDMMTAYGTLERMTVDGSVNTTYADYRIQGEEEIELFYTSTEQDPQEAAYQSTSVDERSTSTDN